MPRKERLSRSADIQKVLKQSRRAMHPAMLVRVRFAEHGLFRSTVVVSSAVSKKATIRNRVKRQVRHQLKELLKQADPQKGYDIMVTVKTPLLTTPTEERSKILFSLLNKIGIKIKASVETNK